MRRSNNFHCFQSSRQRRSGIKGKRERERRADSLRYRRDLYSPIPTFQVDNLRFVSSTVLTTPSNTNQTSPKTLHWNRNKTLSTLLTFSSNSVLSDYILFVSHSVKNNLRMGTQSMLSPSSPPSLAPYAMKHLQNALGWYY